MKAEIIMKEKGMILFDERDLTKEQFDKLSKMEGVQVSWIKEKEDSESKDFTLNYVGNLNDFTYDFIPLNTFTNLTHDFTKSDFVMFHGAIARDGSYDYYDKEGKKITLYKKWDNLIEVYPQLEYLPLKVSEKKGAHYAQELGFGVNFTPNEETHEIEADLVILDESLFKEIRDKDYHVSPGYKDVIEGDIQLVTDVDHIALSLGNEIGRACTGKNKQGKTCTTVRPIHDQNLTEVV